MLRELSRPAAGILAVLVLLVFGSAMPTHASDDLQTWRFNIEGMT